MINMVTDYLDMTAVRLPEKIAFNDDKNSVTFAQLRKNARAIGCALAAQNIVKRPVAVLMDKNVQCVCAVAGVIYGGCHYTILDVHMPDARIRTILGVLQPAAIITDEEHSSQAAELYGQDKVMIYEQAIQSDIHDDTLAAISESITGRDTLFVLFTSGSTGIPKGVIISQEAIITYLQWNAATFNLGEDTVFANQAPFYFVMGSLELFMPMFSGCTCHIIPRRYMSFPVMLLNWLNSHDVNTIYWVPSILTLIANFKALPEVHINNLRLVLFGGEVMPIRQLNMWRKEYPDAMFVNLYGATETTDIIAYYIVDRDLKDDEMLPIGKSCEHMKLMVLDDDLKEVQKGEMGELFGAGPGIADGYFADPERTAASFIPNPLYKEGEAECFRKMYRIGDLVRVDERGDLIYMGRKDFQIKHMGNRIELGEIETAVSAIEEIEMNCCLYDKENSRIVLFYTGDIDEDSVEEKIRSRVPEYMVPNVYNKLDVMPLNLNGKIDRAQLKERI